MRTNPSMADVLGMMRLAVRMKSGRASTGQGDTNLEKDWQADSNEDENCSLATVEPGAHELGEKADGKYERNRHEDEILEPSQRREAIDARQHDQIKREPG